MQSVVDVASVVTNTLFVALALTCLVRWRRRDSEPAKWAALTFGVLGAVAIAGWVLHTGGGGGEWPDKALLAVFISFPYCLYRFTGAFGPRSRFLDVAATCSWALVVVATLLLPEPPRAGARPAWSALHALALLVVWTALSLVAAARLWWAGRGQATVVRRRMRLLSLASVGMSVALVTGGSVPGGSEGLALVLQLIVLSTSLLFFAGLAPPQFLLASWRSGEEVNLDRAVQSLVAATTREDVTNALLPNVVALLGGRASALTDDEGHILGRHGTVPAEAVSLPQLPTTDSRDSVEVPLRSGRLVVWVSPYTPFFGSKELERLRSLGSLLDVALERIRLSELEEQSRRALERERGFSQFLIRSSSDGMLAFDRELRCTVWNPAMERLTGLSASAVMGKVPFGDDRLAFFSTAGEDQWLQAAIEGKRTVSRESFFELPGTGRKGWFEISYSPLRDESGEVVGGLSVVRDVTARKHAEELRSYLAAMVNSTDEAILSTDLEGVIVSWNPAAERLYGYEADEVVGKHVSLLAPADRRDEVLGIAQRVADMDTVERAESVRLTKDGRRFPVSLTVSPVRTAEGNIVGASHIARDITQLKLAQQALTRAKEEAESANQAKSEFLSRMSHELRTPLNAILGFAQLLGFEDLPADQRESVEHIEKAGRHLLSLINEVLEIARIEAGKLALTLETVNVDEVVQDALGLVRPLAAERRVELHVERSQAGRWHVTADGQRLKQVMLNLLSNAIKYNREGGNVRVSCEQTGAGLVRITVSDTGRGMAPEHMGRLFEPFERLGADDSGVEGTGLGLALSKRLLGGMGGTLEAHSELGVGSRFWLELPVAPSAGVGADEAAPALDHNLAAEPDGRASTVLYIEDNALNRKLVANLLARRPGVRLLEAMQGSMGLDLAQQHHPDLILLDLNLPDMEGMEVLRRLRQGPATRRIPVAVVSADATRAQMHKLEEAGAHAYLTKPIDVRALLAVVDEALATRGVAPAVPAGRVEPAE